MLANFLKKSTIKAIFKLLPATIPATAADAAMLFGIQEFVKLLNGKTPFGILEWFLGMILLALLRFAFLAFRGSIAEHTFRNTGAVLQLRFFNTLKKIHPKFFHKEDSNIKLKAAFEATEVLPKSGESLVQALQAIVQLAVFFPILIYLSWQLTLALFCIVLPVLGIAQKKLRQMGKAEENALACEGALREELETVRDMKRFWSTHAEIKEVSRATSWRVHNLLEIGVKLATKKLTLSLAIETISVIAMTIVLALCAYMIAHGYMTATDLVLYSSAVFLCYKPIKECTRAMPQLRSAATAFKVLDAFEKFEKVKQASPTNNHGINISKIDFSYGQTQVFKEFNFSANKKHIFLLGPNGAGKSTLLRIIARLEIPDSGSVETSGEFLQQGAFFLSQGVFLPPIKILKEKFKSINNDTILEFAKATGVATLLQKQKFSGGESARIGLLWALVSDAKLILLDEPLAFISRFDKDQILQDFLKACDSLNKVVIMSGHEELPEHLKATFEFIEIESGKQNTEYSE